MVSVELPYVRPERDRQGRVTYWYFRRHGRRWRLPGVPLSKEFMAEYQRLLAETSMTVVTAPPDNRRDYLRGTFGALINDYLASGQFASRAPPTRYLYRLTCERLQHEHGWKRVAQLERRHVRQIIDAKSDTPGAANGILRVLKILLNFAVDDGLIQSNPAARFRELPIGEWRSWSDAELKMFEARWPPGSMQRRAYCIALYTGLRKGDQIALTRRHRQDGCIVITQGKTGAEVSIPEHAALKAELARGISPLSHLLVSPTGRPFRSHRFGVWCAQAIRDAGLPDDVTWHGLRKCAARKLADLGLSEETIKSITGHRTSRMVAHYVKGANQRKLATEAIRRWEQSQEQNEG